MTATWPFRALICSLVLHASEALGSGDHHIDETKDSITIDAGAQTARSRRVTAGPEQKSSFFFSSSGDMAPGNTEHSEDEAVLSAMGLSDDDQKARRPSIMRREESLLNIDEGNEGTQAGDYSLPDALLEDSLYSRSRQGARAALSGTDCYMKTWTEWSTCTQTCAGGLTNRKREMVPAKGNGKACDNFDYTLKEEACNTSPCPVPCTFTPWGGWGGCSLTCASGTKVRTRHKDGPFYGGNPCVGTLQDTDNCNIQNCPENCYWQAWSGFGACSATCINGGTFGYKTRNRQKVGPRYGGVACHGHSTDQGLCNTFTCPQDCVANPWGAWSACTQSCSISIVHHGYRIRERTSTPATNGGRECSNNFMLAHCNTQLCPVDCSWLNWGEWGSCSKTCTEQNGASGVKVRVRDKIGPMGAGLDCPGHVTGETACNDFACPVDCTFKEWEEWGSCSLTCASGFRQRQRGKNLAQFGGGDCVGPTVHSESCENFHCPIDCKWTEWGEYMPCSKTCGGGRKHRSRAYDPVPSSGGLPCIGAHIEEASCSVDPCPIDCVWDEWLDWGLCSSSCGEGRRTRLRMVHIVDMYGGIPCTDPSHATELQRNATEDTTHAVEEDDCPATMPCPLDCRFSDWGEWMACNASCESDGHRNANRTILLAENGGLEICPDGPLNKAKECTGELCGVKNSARRLQQACSILWITVFMSFLF